MTLQALQCLKAHALLLALHAVARLYCLISISIRKLEVLTIGFSRPAVLRPCGFGPWWHPLAD